MADETKKTPFMGALDTEIEDISQKILLELETATTTDLTDAKYAKMILRLSDVSYTRRMLQQSENYTTGSEREVGKRAIIKVLLLSTWLQRLYFIIRAFIMGQIGAVVTTLFILYFGTIDVVQGFFIGIFVFVFALVVTRLFDAQITQVTKRVVDYMAGHRAVRDFIMSHF